MSAELDSGIGGRRGASLFGVVNVGTLLLYCGAIALLLVADLWYVDAPSFSRALSSEHVRSAFVMSMVSSVTTTILAILVAVPSAYALSRYRFRGMILLDTLIDMSIVLPPLVVGISILVLFRMGSDFAESGSLVLRGVGGPLAWIMDRFIHEPAGIVVVQFFCSSAYAVRVIKASFDEVDPRTEAVALTLGCTRGQALRLVTLPMAHAGVAAGALLVWARAVGIFGPVMIVAGATRGRTEILPTSIYLEVTVGQLETALALSLVMAGLALAVLLAFRLSTRGRLFGGGGR